MINSDFSTYYTNLMQNPKINTANISDVDHVRRLKRLKSTIADVANLIEYGTAITTPKLTSSDELCIYSNIKPYFHPTDKPIRAKYSDVLLLNSIKDSESIISSLPQEILHHILSLKNQSGFMNCPTLCKHMSLIKNFNAVL